MEFDKRDDGPKKYQMVDAPTAMGIGVALNVLRSIAAGNGTLKEEGESVTGTVMECGQELPVTVTRENLILAGSPALLNEGCEASDRLEDVSCRIYEVARKLSSPETMDSRQYLQEFDEIESFIGDQNQSRIQLVPMEEVNFSPDVSEEREPEVIDHAAIKERLMPLYDDEMAVTRGAIKALKESFSKGEAETFRLIAETAVDLYDKHFDADRSADSKWGSTYLYGAGHVKGPGDMDRFVNFGLRKELVNGLFSLYCQSFGKGRETEKQAIEDVLVKACVRENSESEDIDHLIESDLLLEVIAVTELKLKAHEQLSIDYDSDRYRGDPLAQLGIQPYFNALELAWGKMRLRYALVEGAGVKNRIKSEEGFKGLLEYAESEYLDSSDLEQIKGLSRTALIGNKCLRAYRNACINFVEAVEKITPERYLDVHREERTRSDGSFMTFSEFVEDRREQANS